MALVKKTYRDRAIQLYPCMFSEMILFVLLFSPGAIGVKVVPLDYFGILERFSVYSTVIFNAVLGIYGFIFFDLTEGKQKSNSR